MEQQAQNWRDSNPLRVWRREQKLSQTEVARMCGMTKTTVANWEQGAYLPNDESFGRLRDITKGKVGKAAWQAWYKKMEVAR